MKENKGKGLANEEAFLEGEDVHAQPRPDVSEKRKALSKTVDMGSPPSRRGIKKPRHNSSKFGVVETSLFISPAIAKQPSTVQILDVDPSNPLDATPAKTPTSPPDNDLMTLLRNEGLAWDRFKQAVSDKDIAICYDMYVKEFERSTVHDLFKVCRLILNLSKI